VSPIDTHPDNPSLALYPADGNPPLSIWRCDEDYVDFDSDDPEDAARWLREPPE
jgi:hypothetical protein